MTRKSLPYRSEARRKKVLQKRISDIANHLASGNMDKAEKAKADVEGLKKKLGLI